MRIEGVDEEGVVGVERDEQLEAGTDGISSLY